MNFERERAVRRRAAVPDSDTEVFSAVKGCPFVTVTAGTSCNVTAMLVVDAEVTLEEGCVCTVTPVGRSNKFAVALIEVVPKSTLSW